MPPLATYPAKSNDHGYSCQTWIARQVNEFLHPGTYYCWFASYFNPYDNGDDSNPLMLYLAIDRAVRQNGYNNAKVKEIKANLMYAVQKELTKSGRVSEILSAWEEIRKAPLVSYTPQVWKVERKSVDGRSVKGDYPDEFLVHNLQKSEFIIIIE